MNLVIKEEEKKIEKLRKVRVILLLLCLVLVPLLLPLTLLWPRPWLWLYREAAQGAHHFCCNHPFFFCVHIILLHPSVYYDH